MAIEYIMALAIVFNVVSAGIAIYIVLRLLRIYRLIGDIYILLITMGFLVLTMSSMLSAITSSYTLLTRSSEGMIFDTARYTHPQGS